MNRTNSPKNDYSPVIPMQPSPVLSRSLSLPKGMTSWFSPTTKGFELRQQPVPNNNAEENSLQSQQLLDEGSGMDASPIFHCHYQQNKSHSHHQQHSQQSHQHPQQSQHSQQRPCTFYQTTTTPTFSHSSHYTNTFFTFAAERNGLKRRDAPEVSSSVSNPNIASCSNTPTTISESSDQFKRRKLIAIMNSMSLSSEDTNSNSLSSPTTSPITGRLLSHSNSSLEVEMSDVDNRPIQIFIRTPCSKSFIIETFEQELISDLKYKIQYKLGIPHDLMYLESGGKILYDSKVCGDFNIQKDSTVTVHVRGTATRTISFLRS